ncbi:hypothetical protein HDF12_003788 [Edaphobacter lichenicola]|uniref:Uncharacterized protein n=1 Tax=Tunturiibacter lichenicola TaxID=2051959 RepID=A0A7Y9NPX6_9BACT|nr:hypothetical protein [Edaphobacter lichenicola]
MADYQTAIFGLQENLRLLNGNQNPEALALWNISNALLVVCDALQAQEHRIRRIENGQK